MKTLLICGAGDDNLELEVTTPGQEWAEEVPVTDGKAVIYLNDGIEITAEYVGTWDIRVSSGPASASAWTHRPARGEDADPGPDGRPGYTDQLELTGMIEWADFHRSDGDAPLRVKIGG